MDSITPQRGRFDCIVVGHATGAGHEEWICFSRLATGWCGGAGRKVGFQSIRWGTASLEGLDVTLLTLFFPGPGVERSWVLAGPGALGWDGTMVHGDTPVTLLR